MALLTNINGKFSVDTDGAASFNRIGASTTTGFTFPSADGANGEVLKTNGLGTVSWSPDSSPTVYWAANGNDIYNTNSANVGIGTNSPQVKLHSNVSSASGNFLTDSSIYALELSNSDTTAGNAVGINFGHGGYHFTNFISSVRIGTGANPKGDLVFGGRPSDGATFVERMRITSDGQILMTKSGADYNLVITNSTAGGDFIHCIGDAGDTVFKLDSGGTGGEAVLQMYSDGVLKNSINANGNTYFNNIGNVGIGTVNPRGKLEVEVPTGTGIDADEHVLISDGVATNPQQMRLGVNTASNYSYIQSAHEFIAYAPLILNPKAGNVGIGTTSPTQKLNVVNDNTGTWTAKFTNNTNNVYLSVNDANNYGIYVSGETKNYFSGKVGIGVTSPGAKFQVGATISTSGTGISVNAGVGGGNIISVGTTNHNWLPFTNGQNYYSSDVHNFRSASHAVTYMVLNSTSLTASGDIVAYGSPSDKRLKENIKPIESALDKAMKLQGVTFDWKKSDSILKIKEDIGFIAQDVQKVIPELVRENEDGMLSMRHQGIAPILLEAIKELKAEIEELKLNKCNCNCNK